MDWLALTLAGQSPARNQGRTEQLSWHWRGPGLLELIPHESCDEAWVISAGIHGDETAPIELLAELTADWLAGRRPLACRLLLILGNPAAMAAGRRYLDRDLNRLFDGPRAADPPGAEPQRARQLEAAVADFWQAADTQIRRHYDLHTAIRASAHLRFALLPAQERGYDAAMLRWLPSAGIEALVRHSAPGRTFSHFTSARFGAASCTLELGKARPFGQNDLSQFAQVKAALAAGLAADAGALADLPQTTPKGYRVSQELRKHSEAFVLHLPEATANFTAYAQGTLLAEDGPQQYRVQAEQEYLLFPNARVAPGLRAGLMLTEIPLSQLADKA